VIVRPDGSDPWQGLHPVRNPFDDSRDSTDEKIQVLRKFLEEFSPSLHETIAAIQKEARLDSDFSNSEDEWDSQSQFVIPGATIKRHHMQQSIQEFHLSEVGEESHLAFCEQCIGPEFRTSMPDPVD
jgi:hypothetical protein